jgi:2,4-dienoyl-CoA reductase (NADPH2)
VVTVPTEDVIFTPLAFRNLVVKNRVMRSSMTGRFDNYDGSGTQVRVNWDTKFAAGGVGAVVSAHVPVHRIGRIMPNVFMLDDDDKIPFLTYLVSKIHEHDCKYIVQLSHAGRQRDIAGIENSMKPGLSSTSKSDPVQGFSSVAMTIPQIQEVTGQFGAAARRAQLAGADGLETHSANGYLFTQFLSATINDREDEYGGSLENRARFLLDVIDEIRDKVGPDFHLQVKLSGLDYANVLNPFVVAGTTLEDSVQVARWCVEHGADAIVVSAGSFVPHPKMPPGDFPIDAYHTYDSVADEGSRTFFNYLALRQHSLAYLFRAWWRHRRGPGASVPGMHTDTAAAIRRALHADPERAVPVLVTGGFQSADVVRRVLTDGVADGVTIARPLIANPDLLSVWLSGRDEPERPCSFCNSCLLMALESPLGCYDVRRFGGNQEAMGEQIMTVFTPRQQLPADDPR